MEYDLVFEGGGAKGMVFVGAMQEFEARGHTYKRLLGTSAGAITAATLAAGYDSVEMQAALVEKDDNGKPVFAQFMGIPPGIAPEMVRDSVTRQLLRQIDLPLVPEMIENRLDDWLATAIATNPKLRGVFSFLEYGGWFSADHFVTWMQHRLDTGSFRGQPRRFSGLTLEEFHRRTGVDLSLIASDTTGERMLVLNHRTAPDVPVVWAVRMSMSIPLLWQSVVWKSEWGSYLGNDLADHEIVDGGLLSNFPIELFVSQDPTVKSVMGEETGGSVLGMLIDETLPVEGVAEQALMPGSFRLSELRTVQRLAGLMNTALTAHDKMVIDAFERLVARMPARGFGTTEFDMSDEKRECLVRAGRSALTDYFARRARDGVSFDPADTQEFQRAVEKADQRALKILGE